MSQVVKEVLSSLVVSYLIVHPRISLWVYNIIMKMVDWTFKSVFYISEHYVTLSFKFPKSQGGQNQRAIFRYEGLVVKNELVS